ncbi:hypothetical protein JTB14_017543 [Gonioctena quinquepunctata]|nr:hypothetical protein JTB14_017543 [Gonioctena quinquepunctata]
MEKVCQNLTHPRTKSNLARINALIMGQNPYQDIRRNPVVHRGLNSTNIEIRQELYYLSHLDLRERKEKLWDLLRSDFLQEEDELRQVGLAYINTQP